MNRKFNALVQQFFSDLSEFWCLKGFRNVLICLNIKSLNFNVENYASDCLKCIVSANMTYSLLYVVTIGADFSKKKR
jgi:hypothetical protein